MLAREEQWNEIHRYRPEVATTLVAVPKPSGRCLIRLAPSIIAPPSPPAPDQAACNTIPSSATTALLMETAAARVRREIPRRR